MWSVLIHWRSSLVSCLWQHFNNPKTEELSRTLKSRQMLLLEKRMIQCKSLFSVQNMQRSCSLLFAGRKQGVCHGWSIGGVLIWEGGLNRGFMVVTSIPNEWEKRVINANSKRILRNLFVGVYVMFVTLVCFLNMGVENDFFWSRNRVKIWRTGQHNPSKISQEYPRG